jgi:hypothetical protein
MYIELRKSSDSKEVGKINSFSSSGMGIKTPVGFLLKI